MPRVVSFQSLSVSLHYVLDIRSELIELVHVLVYEFYPYHVSLVELNKRVKNNDKNTFLFHIKY